MLSVIFFSSATCSVGSVTVMRVVSAIAASILRYARYVLSVPALGGRFRQQPALAGQLDAPGTGPVDQLPDQLLVQCIQLPLYRLGFLNRLSGDDHVAHQLRLPPT